MPEPANPADHHHAPGVVAAPADDADRAVRLCALVPVYDHAGPLGGVLDGLRDAGLHVFVVDDGSSAACARVIDTLAAAEPTRTLVRLPRNGGKGAAVQAGFAAAFAAGFTHALQVDADGQHDLSALPALRAQCAALPAALVSGRPQYDESVPKSRLYGRYATHVWVWINTLSLAIVDSMCGFRIYPLRASLDACRRFAIGTRMDFDTDLMVRMYWLGVPMRFVGVPVRYPEDGVSHFDVWRDNLRLSSMHTRHFLYMLWRVLTLRPRPDRLVGRSVTAAMASAGAGDAG